MLNVYFYWQSFLNLKLCLQNKRPKNKNNLPTPCFHTLSAAACCIWQWSMINEALFGVTTLPATLNTLSLLLWIFSYFHFSWDNLLKDCLKKWESSWMYSMNIIHNKCVFFKISSAAKVAFLGVGRSSKENLSLPYSLLLDYSTLSSLPYPTLPYHYSLGPAEVWRGWHADDQQMPGQPGLDLVSLSPLNQSSSNLYSTPCSWRPSMMPSHRCFPGAETYSNVTRKSKI